MSITRRIVFASATAWLSRAVAIALGVLLLPVLFRHLPNEELGVWLLLGQSWAAMGVLDLGFGVALTRRIALAKGKSGGDPTLALNQDSRNEIADLVTSGTLVYRYLAGGISVVVWVAGVIYIESLQFSEVSHRAAWVAWTIVCASQAINVWSSVWTCLLNGVGYVGWDSLIASATSVATLGVQILAVLLGGGLASLAAVAAVGALVQRSWTRWLARRKHPELFAMRGDWNPIMMRSMAGVAARAWVTAAGAVLVFSTDTWFIASSLGAASVPPFRAAYVLVHNFTVIAVSFGLASAVFVSQLWQAQDVAAMHRLVARNCRLGLLVMLFAAALLLTVGRELIGLWLGPGHFVGYTVLAIVIAFETLEAHAYIISTSSRATNDEAFAWSSVAAGVLKMGLAAVLVQRLGVLGVALATMVALLCTNHWYMAYRGLTRLGIPFAVHAKQIVMPCVAWSVVAVVAARFLSAQLSANSDFVRLAVVALSLGLLFVLACGTLVLQPQERRSVYASVLQLAARSR